MKKRLWSILLVACLIVSLLPTTALAAEANGVKTEEELRAAIDAATGTESDPTVIQLLESIEINSSIVIPDGKYIELVGESDEIMICPSSTFHSTLFAPALIGIGHADNNASNITTALILKNMILDGKNATRCIAVHKGNYLTTQNVVLRNGTTGAGSSGGGIAVCWHGESEKAHFSLTDTEIHDCSAGIPDDKNGKYGGAINTYNNADVSMSNVNFHDNYANWGGSAIYQGKLILSGNIVLGKDDTGNGVYDANIVISSLLGDSSEIYIGTPSSRTTIAMAGEGYTITQADLQKFHLKYVSHNNTNVADQYTIYLDKDNNAFKLAEAAAVTFCANDGTNAPIMQKVPKNIAAALNLNSFTRPGYTFTGWNTKADGSGRIYQDGQEVTLNANLDLYAQWRKCALSEITVAPKENAKFTYGSTLGSSDFVVTKVYDNGETVTVDPENYTVSPSALETVGENVPVTVTYQAKSYNCTIRVDKAPQAAPAAPTRKDRTYTSITLNEVADAENGAKAEYSKDGGKTWQDSPEFTDLTSGTTYTFAVRYAETDTYNASEIATANFATLRHSSGGSSSSSTPTNTVSASTASNGKVALDKSTAKKGNTVTVTVTPNAGYQLDKLTVTDAKGKTVDVTKKSDGKFTFTMPDSKVTITPTFSKIEDTKPSKTGFNDVASSAWYADAVQYVTDKGLMNGTDDNQFSPNASTTRGMLMTVLARYAGEDTTGGATWYEKGMNWAKAKGVSDGTNPNANITREQLVTMMYRYAGSPKADGKLDSFSDAASVSTYAADAMQWAVANGIVNGSNGKLNPQNNATRAEVAAILMRFCEMSK